VVNGDVVFERIRASDVVIILVFTAPNDAAVPSLMFVFSLMQTGKVASPACFSTLGLLGASSAF
jgi:hypothetical protein